MIRFYFHPTPNPAKVALFLEEAGLPYEVVPVDTSKGEQHMPAFRGLYLGDKTGQFVGSPEDRPELLSWLLFIASGLGPYSGQAVHFQFAAPEGLAYAVNRYRREAERHYQVLNDHLAGREFIVGNGYTIADMSAWGWLDRAARVMKGSDDALAPYPHLKRLFQTVDARPAVERARAVGRNHEFKKVNDEETKRALFPSNYPPAA
jgi:GST-like protein